MSKTKKKTKQRAGEISATVVDVTPKLAAEYLKKNTQNRPVNNMHVSRLAADMTAGEWQVNGEAIIFADDGTLLDGQHRLEAVVLSGATVPMSVVAGVSKDAFKTIDIGKKRTGADALATFDERFMTHRVVMAAAIRNIAMFDADGAYKDKRVGVMPHGHTIEFATKNRKQLERALDHTLHLSWARRLVPASCLVALYFLFSQKDPFETERFFHKLNTGENMSKDDPINLLRNRLMEMRSAGTTVRATDVLPYVVKAWEIVRSGRTVQRLMVPADYVPTIV